LHRLLLDRGFAGIEVQEFLDQQQIPALIACTIRGKSAGTRALCQDSKSYRAQRTFKSVNGKLRTAELAVCWSFTTAKHTKRLKRRATWQLLILIHPDTSS
jgi:putative transposase